MGMPWLGRSQRILRMRITRNGKDIRLDQRDYLDKVLERFSMTNAKSAPTPLPSNWVPQLNKEKASPELLRNYQSIIGSLLYLMIGTRPDIAFAVTKLAQFSANPSQEHFERAKYICRYFVGTLLVPRIILLCSNMLLEKVLPLIQTQTGHLTPLQGSQSQAIILL